MQIYTYDLIYLINMDLKCFGKSLQFEHHVYIKIMAEIFAEAKMKLVILKGL